MSIRISVLPVRGERVGDRGPVVRVGPGVEFDVVRQEAFLPVQQLLGGNMELLSLALADGNLSVNNILHNLTRLYSSPQARSSLLSDAYLHSL